MTKGIEMKHRFWSAYTALTGALLLSGGVARADDHQCSNATLRGTYAFAAHGSLVGIIVGGTVYPYASPQLIDGVAVQTFDGRGSITRKDFLMNTGMARPGAVNSAGFAQGQTGGYQMNSDCTGSMHIEFPGAPQAGAILDVQIVVERDGRIVRGVLSREQVPGSLPSGNGTPCGSPCLLAPQISLEGTRGDFEGGR
jgi:hypothetical protein